LTPLDFFSEVIPDVDKMLEDKNFNEYVSKFEAAAKGQLHNEMIKAK
jgi:hypothetical protein